MPDAGYNMGALEDCRSALEGKAGPVGAIGDGFEGRHVEAASFGELDAAAGLADAVTKLDETAKQQFDAAEQLLRSVSGALDAVRTSVEDIDRDNADSMRV
ncbi:MULTISPECIES: hypothetical protein [Saccharopolyspora]|uniref:ESX-1 secretion-associated protein n=1 Tax=Saccharopolyspora gregorii TaxID=33914 RepID=A0ABP6S0K2_9PSEU|nr:MULTISPECIES: hypothetical protein [Saccharopolyspora]MCA1189503.1 hypothetical protein [Saccharopolyspora sp. 6T]MCA1192980.1 hypothetical protein [Saccharopolyspora sp. 6V]MCA1228861.1 hypothetical protein [Saccharopolyspora sp. 6M]MCA1282603.1 hypothetical protein [Saccharopolyspora sp. 7B]